VEYSPGSPSATSAVQSSLVTEPSTLFLLRIGLRRPACSARNVSLLDLLREALCLEELRLCINLKYKEPVSQIKSVNYYLFRVNCLRLPIRLFALESDRCPSVQTSKAPSVDHSYPTKVRSTNGSATSVWRMKSSRYANPPSWVPSASEDAS
jgi:hypothetical protein